MKTLRFSILLVPLFLCLPIQAQQTGKKSDPTLEESVEDVKESIRSIGALFKKKDKTKDDKDGEPGKGETPDQTVGGAAENRTSEPQGPNGNIRHIQGGKISENVVYLEAERFTHFNDGVAIVHKGTATAMINAKGEMVFPYNTHDFFAIDNTFLRQNHRIAHTGLFPFNLKRQYMNAKGKELKVGSPSLAVHMGFMGYAEDLHDLPKTRQGRYQFRQTYMDKEGRTHTFLNISLTKINEGIGAYSRNIDGQWLHGFYWITGEKICDPQYHEIEAFSEGMAVVGQRDGFGQMKYGYINTRGELAIPLMFSKKPHGFSGGYAKVEPKDKTEFDYAFIDRKGKVVFSQSGMDKRKQGNFEFQPFQDYGLTTTTGNFYVMDSDFKIQTKNEFFEGYGIPGNTHFHFPDFGDNKIGNPGLFTVLGETDPKIYFTNNEMNHEGILRGKELRVGFINLGSGTVVLPAFSLIGPFDPISGLAYAELSTVVKTNNGLHNALKTTKGYINEKGEWVILQKEGGSW